jgi:DNA-binding NarL/FixJ family response regulator
MTTAEMLEESRRTAARGTQRIFIVDDHPIVRQGLAKLLDSEPDLVVCGGAEDAAGALDQLPAARPDLLVVDLSLKDSLGFDLIGQLRDRDPRVRVLVWSMLDEVAFAERALRAGALGFVSKQDPVESVIVAIRRVLNGEIYVSPRLSDQLFSRRGALAVGPQDTIGSLSNRELEVLEFLGRGRTTQQIANRLGLSPKTVESYREKLKTKLGLKNSAELMRRAIEWFLEKR